MNQAPSPERMVKGATRILPFERVALVLQGGGALGAYQAGVYHALHEASIDVRWLCGTSIGAINGAIIAGNPPEKRVERLRDFWETVTTPPVRIPNIPWFTELAWNGNAHTRYWANRMSAFSTMLHGAPGFFSPRPLPPLNSAADSPEAVSYYDIAPLKETLARLVDFDLINDNSMRFTVPPPMCAAARRSISTIANRRSARRTSWPAHRCRRAFRRPKSTANISGMAASSRIRRCSL